MNNFRGSILQLLICLCFACSLFSCMNNEMKTEAIENQEEKTVVQFNPRNYRFPREEGITKGGYPFTLSGKPITKTPLIVNSNETQVKDYPEYYFPGDETLADNEMRITIMGSGIPAPIRPAQATSCILVQLGNGDSFIFDIGSDNVGKLYSMGLHPSELDKVFITHLHLDHVGGIFPLFDAMGWARNTPLRVWGPSGHSPELGTKAFTQNVRKAAEWHTQSK
jgi:ribonuclease Z